MRTSETAVHARFKLSSRFGSYSCVYRPSPNSKEALGYNLAMCCSGVLLTCHARAFSSMTWISSGRKICMSVCPTLLQQENCTKDCVLLLGLLKSHLSDVIRPTTSSSSTATPKTCSGYYCILCCDLYPVFADISLKHGRLEENPIRRIEENRKQKVTCLLR